MLAQTELPVKGMWLGLDVGGADVNGSVRAQLPNTNWTGLDIGAAPGVDIVADAATFEWLYDHGTRYDLVIATELFEHAEKWRDILAVMTEALALNGPQLLIATCASTGRPPHGSRGEWGVPDGQYYGNVDPDELRTELEKYFREVHVEFNPNPGDVYCWARGLL